MAKPGLYKETITRGFLKSSESGWTLCVGAGIFSPLIPTWFELVDRLIQHNCAPSDQISIKDFKRLGFSAEAMIEAVKNRLQLNDEDFLRALSRELYTPLIENTTPEQWEAFKAFHEGKPLSKTCKSDRKRISQVVDGIFAPLSASMIARTVIRSLNAGCEPRSVISFNGDNVLISLLNYYNWTMRNDFSQKFDRVINGLTPSARGRIPLIYCHGAVPIDHTKIKRGYDSKDKLVFSEASYLELANSPVSWQSVNFLDAALNTRMVFIGVSLKDPNMRRWLGWVHQNKLAELKHNNIVSSTPTEHYWINKLPETESERIWIEESVAHLGVRLIWLNDWSETEEILGAMLNLS